MKKIITGILILLICISFSSAGYAVNNISFEEIDDDIGFIESEEMFDLMSAEDFEIVGFTNLKSNHILRITELKSVRGETIYFVEPGDSLYKIAQRFDTTIEKLREKNSLTTDELHIGQELLIPSEDGSEIPGEPDQIYYVKPGDSLYKIAQRFDTTIEKLREKNSLTTDELYVGQELLIPSEDGSETPGRSDTDQVYYVKPGDSLYKIARRFDITIEKLRGRNNLTTDELYVGQTLLIPAPEIPSGAPDIVLDYTVEQYDNLIRIARKFNISAHLIRLYNNLQTDRVSVGQELSIPLYITEGIMKEYEKPVSQEELQLLARAVYSEARGEPFKGQVAVAEVILNRVRHPYFPDTIKGVIFQPWQFTAIHDGQFWLEPSQMAYLAVEAALDGWDPTSGAIYYYNPETATSDWVFYRNIVIKIGNHYFAV